MDALLFGRHPAPVDIRGPRATPVVGWRGNLVRFYQDPLATLLHQASAYGPLSTLVDRNPSFLFAFGPEYNRRLTTERDLFDPFITPLKAPPGSALDLLGRNPFMLVGDDHRRHRRILVPPFHRKRIERYRDVLVDTIETLLSTWRVGQTVDLPAVLQNFTLAVVLRVVFGLDDHAGSARVTMMRTLLGDLIHMAGAPSVVFLQHDLPGMPYRRLNRLAEAFISEVEGLVAERRATGADTAAIDDLIAGHLEHPQLATVETRGRWPRLTGLDELPAQLFALLTAGHETTFASLSWTLFLLARHPAVLRALGGELNGLGGAAPRVDQLADLPLLDQVIKESLRLLPTAPYGARQARADFTLDHHALPAGAVILFSHIVTHHMPSIYPEPKRFLPERWRTADPVPAAYLPFGHGARACPGADLATLEMKLVLATLLQRFWPEVSDGTRVDARLRLTLTPPSLPVRLLPVGQSPRVGRLAGTITDLVDV